MADRSAHPVRRSAPLAIRLTLGRYFTEGARQLWQAAERSSIGNKEALAHRVGFPNASYLHAHLYGDKVPRAEARERYRRHLGIPLSAWEMPPSAPFRLPALVPLCDRAEPILAVAGHRGVEVPSFARACAFDPSPAVSEGVARTVLEALRVSGVAEQVGTRWRSRPEAAGALI